MRVQRRRKESLRSLSHLLMSFLFVRLCEWLSLLINLFGIPQPPKHCLPNVENHQRTSSVFIILRNSVRQRQCSVNNNLSLTLFSDFSISIFELYRKSINTKSWVKDVIQVIQSVSLSCSRAVHVMQCIKLNTKMS